MYFIKVSQHATAEITMFELSIKQRETRIKQHKCSDKQFSSTKKMTNFNFQRVKIIKLSECVYSINLILFEY
ncbi:hypothetical protein VAS14_22047 [Photobacterium angustum S14]|uniref:Uncharacterized protein n=1 Tax=Photobacterium angustum (strain S14 / CCUG 15956) TaxID=314292 RepID=Q1ZK49_PHOAS|nr:hypothetical protein VAS14_22047 [Photobacterium angustum S14]